MLQGEETSSFPYSGPLISLCILGPAAGSYSTLLWVLLYSEVTPATAPLLWDEHLLLSPDSGSPGGHTLSCPCVLIAQTSPFPSVQHLWLLS